MEEKEVKVLQTSIAPEGKMEPIRPAKFALPTWGIIIFLFIVFFVLKSFIYIKDNKRHGK